MVAVLAAKLVILRWKGEGNLWVERIGVLSCLIALIAFVLVFYITGVKGPYPFILLSAGPGGLFLAFASLPLIADGALFRRVMQGNKKIGALIALWANGAAMVAGVFVAVFCSTLFAL